MKLRKFPSLMEIEKIELLEYIEKFPFSIGCQDENQETKGESFLIRKQDVLLQTDRALLG